MNRQYKNLEKPKYCKHCNYTYTVRSWSAHINTNKHKKNIKNKNKSVQIPITNFFNNKKIKIIIIEI